MDYMTKPITRATLRDFASIIRGIFKVPIDQPFPVLKALDLMHKYFPGTTYEIVEDYELDENVPAQCDMRSDGTFNIVIKASVYDGAYSRNSGGCRNHILHEICHVFLYYLGYRPVTQRSFSNREIVPYCSVEWQAKALCGEVMIPHEAAKKMSVQEIVEHYYTSREAAAYQKKVAYR